MSYSIRQQKYLQKRLRVRALHLKGLTVTEISKETSLEKNKILEILEDANLKPKYKQIKREPHAFANHCGKRVKI